MILNKLKPRKSLNKAFLKVKPSRSEIEAFKLNLIQLIDRTNSAEHEEFNKNLVSDFLKKTYFEPNYFINTKERNDLVIHNGKEANSTVGVIIEAKKPNKKAEMLSLENFNKKALHELILYYLRERITVKNLEIKCLIATNVYEWFIFDASVFEKHFAQNKKLVKQFEEFEAGRLTSTNTDYFYNEIAKPFVEHMEGTLDFTHFDLYAYEKPLRNDNPKDDNKLIALFKLLSPEHLLKLPFANDSNSLDRKFYSELLHIIGLSETKEGGKKVIQRNKESDRNSGSLLENTLIELDSVDTIYKLTNSKKFGDTYDSRLFNVGLELVITWVNRILFLKLLEAQLLSYQKGDKSYAFLNIENIQNYDQLNRLFFQVLAKKQDQRNDSVKIAFAKIPYLNSSLFDANDLERETIYISNLQDEQKLPIFSTTVLKDQKGKRRTGELNALEYFFAFLDAYDFSSEGSENIQEDNKTLINASVLGLIFEKINGYKDGSFFTPGFITMYMCRETIRRAVVQKFNETKSWNCENLDEIYDKIDDRQEANEIINSLKICDPAVGSGHFLVSALNEIIAIKNDLKILQDLEGKRLKEYVFEVVNDELVVTDDNGELFEYQPNNKEAQRVQEALFHEKQTIIENCLFGVDINPNSVKICQLRLWIELLKNAYYKNETELETLPNIDINIKCGNSLISRFSLDADIKQALKRSKWTIDTYRNAVDSYRNAQNKEQKREMQSLINDIKSDFTSEIAKNDPKLKQLQKLSAEQYTKYSSEQLFDLKLTAAQKRDRKNLNDKISKLTTEVEDIKNNKIYENAFEWRFEFPEVLNDDGDFVGFDVVIGNPPYIRQEEFSEIKPYLKSQYSTFTGTADLYVYFVERAFQIAKTEGQFVYIIPNKWMRAGYGTNLRSYLKSQNLIGIYDFGDLPVFEEATTYPCILFASKKKSSDTIQAASVETLDFGNDLVSFLGGISYTINKESLQDSGWTLTRPAVQQVIDKIKSKGISLGEYANEKILSGIKTGFNEAFVIDNSTRDLLIKEDNKSEKVIKPFLGGRNIKRYTQPNPNQWLLFIPWHFPLENDKSINGASKKSEEKFKSDYPAIYNHLLKFKKELSSRNKSETGVRYEWYALQRCAASYHAEFENPKVMLPDISIKCEATYDTNGFYCVNTAYIIPSLKKSDLGILNSKLVLFFYSNLTQTIRGGYYRFIRQYLEKIPMVNSDSLESKVNQILTLKKENSKADTSALEAEIDQMVYELYDLTEDEIKIVEESVK